MEHKIELRKLLTLREAASILRLHPETLRRFIREKNEMIPNFINANPIGKKARYLFHEDDVYRFINDMKKAP